MDCNTEHSDAICPHCEACRRCSSGCDCATDPHEGIIRAWWDDQDGVYNPGWYVEVKKFDAMGRRGRVILHSMQVGFPVNVDNYTETQADEVEAAIKLAFPNHEVRMVK